MECKKLELTKPNLFWKLDQNNRITDVNEEHNFNQWHEFITLEWGKKHVAEALHVYKHIDQTKFDHKTSLKKAEKLKQLLIKAIDQAPKIPIEIDEKLKENLMCHSPVFQTMFNGNWSEFNNESEITKLSFTLPKGVNREDYKTAIQCFLKYIKNQEVEFSGDNVMHVYSLAHQYHIPVLMGKCEEFLNQNSNIKDAINLLETAQQFPDLRWSMLKIILNERTWLIEEFLKNQQVSSNTKDILKLAINLKEKKMTDILSNERKNTLQIDKDIAIETLEVIKQLNKICKVDGLKISKIGIPPELTEIIPSLTFLVIKNKKTEVLPAAWEKTLEHIDCSHCDALTKLNVPNAITIKCNSCISLTTLSAPKATTINCHNCQELPWLQAPIATIIDCRWCYTITTLDAPEATTISCGECDALKTIHAPKVTTIDCTNCKNLPWLYAPRATSIECRDCNALTSLNAPKASTVDCRDCNALTTLNVPKASTIDCRDCKALKRVNFANTTDIKCTGCDALNEELNIIQEDCIIL